MQMRFIRCLLLLAMTGTLFHCSSADTGDADATQEELRRCRYYHTCTSNTVTTVDAGTTGDALLNWSAPTTFSDGTPLTDITGYKVHYGTAPGSYTTTVALSSPSALTDTIGNLVGGHTYYFAVTVVSASGGESAYSNEASKAIP